MMNIVTALQKDRFTPRYYVAALTDNMSLQKAQVYEQSLIQSEEKTIKNAHFMQIYRSREVGQTYITSIATTLLATMHAMWLVISIRPQVIFCNGPGTCFPLCVCAFALKNRTWADINLVTIANLFIHNLKLMPDLDAICLSTVAPAATKLPSSILRWPFDVKTHPHPMLGYHVYQVKIMNTLTIFVH
ncbi:UDP-N-acetylglucosamine transferase subunit ALG14 homolog isoform X4 [Panicum virgatum]|nr:UDP-N-acetylglucosamine transferase subunit ALG14 homolog isoform X4 [Panicum virgatum]XP_039790319.1 UDP-N-acetylglucosamine transferase subunit ALG14 homolog isoform X4 [Panicum virgatum]XP_039790320.1 UDP-N-acetylglucosamine transferase subunit ALG14 homolog isoform X4 [Panicum virgatum]